VLESISCGYAIPPLEWLKREHGSSTAEDISEKDSGIMEAKEVTIPVIEKEDGHTNSADKSKSSRSDEWETIQHQSLGESILSEMLAFKWTYLDKNGRSRTRPKISFYEHVAPQTVSRIVIVALLHHKQLPNCQFDARLVGC
jgi:archaellum component FlaD/FlaE